MILLLCIICSALPAHAASAAQQSELAKFLPADNEVRGWSQEDPPRSFHGDELFMMIDGGADIYQEYGFSQVLATTYADAAGNTVKIELYKMNNPAAAWGIYTFKTGENGQTLPIGQEALFEEYYLNFWKGNLLVTLVAGSPHEPGREGLIALAKAVDARIPETGKRPDLADKLLKGPHALSHPQYICGLLGLMKVYVFDTKNVFLVKKGLAGTLDNCKAVVLAYENNDSAVKALTHGMEILREKAQRFTDMKQTDGCYSMADRDKLQVRLQTSGRYIIAVIGQDENACKTTADALADKLAKD